MSDHPDNAEAGRTPGAFFSREAVRGMHWMVAGKLALFFVYFAVSMLTVNGLGRERFGVYSLMANIASNLLVVCGLGLGSALMRYIPELAARKNRWGLIHLLWKSAALQAAAMVAATALLLLFSEPLQRLFKAGQVAHFRLYLALACGLAGLLLLKEFVGTVFTCIYKTRVVASLALAHGLAWLAALAAWIRIRPDVGTVILVQMGAIGLVYLAGAGLLVRQVRALPWTVREFGIGRRRTLAFSGTIMLGSILRMAMFKYSEVFFLAAVGGTTLAGVYDLAYSLPYTAITFIPLALLPLFTAAFAEAYVKDPHCLGRLIAAYYKLLVLLALPLAVLGAFFAPAAYRIIYRGAMDEAGLLASAFSVVLLLPLVSMPLSAAIKAKERMLDMLPMLLLQIAVNLALDWLLIVHLRWGAWGGILAVVGTFALTIPVRLRVVRSLLGGIYFPVRFFLRIAAALAAEGAAFFWIVRQTGLFGLFDHPRANVGLLFAVGGCFGAVFLLLVRRLRLVRHEDVADFRALEIERLNQLLRILVR